MLPISIAPIFRQSSSRQRVARIAMRSVALVSILLIGASILLAAWPSRLATPLISKDGWSIQGQAFQNVTPRRYEVRDSIRKSPQSTYWRTWSPDTLATKGEISTHPFKAPRYMAVPYGGFAGNPDISVRLICQETGRYLTVASARTNTQMTEALVHVPKGWCGGNVILSAKSQSTTEYVEIGTPFRISRLDYYKNTFFGLIGVLAVVFGFAWGLVFLPSAIGVLRGASSDAPIIGMAAVGLIGYAMFFVFFFSRAAGIFSSALLFLLEASLLIWLHLRRREVLRQAWSTWKTPTLLWATVVLVGFCLAMVTSNGAGPWTVNALFYPVRWSTDNQIPMQIAEYLFHGLDPRTLDFGPWKVSDRPPLAYGLMAPLRLLSWMAASHNDGYSLYYQYQQISGIVINGLWVVALFYLLRSLRLTPKAIVWILLVVGLTPFVIFNNIYIWPKLLGAAFALFAFIKLFDPSHYLETQRHDRFRDGLIWAALFSGLALLSHGGTAFGIIAAILVAVWYRGLPSMRLAIKAGLLGLLILAPWALWQHLEQPPGNALVKYAFSGDFGFGESAKSVTATVQEAYAKLTPQTWLKMKINAVRVLASGQGSTCEGEVGIASSFYDQLRIDDFFYVGPSLRFLALGFIPLIFLKSARSSDKPTDGLVHFARIMVSVGLISIGLYTLAGFDCYINLTQSYQAILEIYLGLALALYCMKKWYSHLALWLSIAYGLTIWMIEPLVSASSLNYASVLVLSLLAVVIFLGYRRTRNDSLEGSKKSV